MSNGPVRITAFASGKGSNLDALFRALNDRVSDSARIVLCVSNKEDAGALNLAEERGIPARYISKRSFATEHEYETRLVEELENAGTEMIALAGYLRLLPEKVVSRWQGRIFNIHPAPLPRFGGKGMYGLNVHREVIKSGHGESGATVHLVTEEYDEGAVVGFVPVRVTEGEEAESLASRVLAVEHRLYPLVLGEAAALLRQTGRIDPAELGRRVEQEIEQEFA